MATPEQEYAALMKEWEVVWAEHTAAWLGVHRKQIAAAHGRDNPSVAEEYRFAAARAAVKKVDTRIDEFMARQGFPRK